MRCGNGRGPIELQFHHLLIFCDGLVELILMVVVDGNVEVLLRRLRIGNVERGFRRLLLNEPLRVLGSSALVSVWIVLPLWVRTETVSSLEAEATWLAPVTTM